MNDASRKDGSVVPEAVAEIVARLDAAYGRPRNAAHRPVLDQLILTILSQHTSDLNAERAFAALRSRFPTWDEARAASTEAIATAITIGGLANRKAAIIKAVLDDPDLDATMQAAANLPLDEARARLTAYPGVGPKTAACVLLFGCGRPALPVDTHVYRVSRRLGLIDASIGPELAHDELQRQVCPDDVYSFHVNMIRHGRRVCRAREPDCHRCVLNDLCAYYAERNRASSGEADRGGRHAQTTGLRERRDVQN